MRRFVACLGSLAACALLNAAGAGAEGGDSTEGRSDAASASWPQSCSPPPRYTPLGVEAAREAHRLAARRHELRLREAAAPGYLLRRAHERLDPAQLALGALCPSEVADLGSLLFEHEYGFVDGLGGGDAATRPKGPFRRVHEGDFGGPETTSCTSCHWVGGPNGAGSETDNTFLGGDGVNIGSADARNPPALTAPGVVEALAKEMTRELAAQRDALVREALDAAQPREQRLSTKGVDFGLLRVAADGEIDVSQLDGVDADLVVKPFGWKGTVAEFSQFTAEALQMHMGMQSEYLIATASQEMLGAGNNPDDPDADGRKREIGAGPLLAINVHLALLEVPIVEPLVHDRFFEPAARALLAPTNTSFVADFQRGRRAFHELGCASCHKPMLLLDSPILNLDGLPPIDLAANMAAPALRYDAELGGYPVWLFSDLKRHDMGAANAAQHEQAGVEPRYYLTPRLWGVADSAPYLHDGRAPSLEYAIVGHDGEAAASRDAYRALSREERGALRVYLMSLRRQPRVIVP